MLGTPPNSTALSRDSIQLASVVSDSTSELIASGAPTSNATVTSKD